MSLSDSLNSSKTAKGAKTGGEWKGKVYFDPNADKAGTEEIKEFSKPELILGEMRKIIEENEKIEYVWWYVCPLFSWQLTKKKLNHQFIVFETNKWWWSIEKNSEGITIQRAKSIEHVKDHYRRNPRKKPVDEIKHGKGRKGMKDLVLWLSKSKELYKEYHWRHENCKHFANRVFANFADSTNLVPDMECIIVADYDELHLVELEPQLAFVWNLRRLFYAFMKSNFRSIPGLE